MRTNSQAGPPRPSTGPNDPFDPIVRSTSANKVNRMIQGLGCRIAFLVQYLAIGHGRLGYADRNIQRPLFDRELLQAVVGKPSKY